MYTTIIKILSPYAMKIAGGLVIALVVVGSYFYWKHEIVSDALKIEREAWNKRDAETERRGQELLKLKNLEIDRIRDQQRETYLGAIKDYAKHIQNLNDQLDTDRNKRMFVNTAKASCDRDALPGKARNPNGTGGESSGILQTELEPETAEAIRANAAEVETGARLCEILIERFLIPESVLK